MEIIKIGILGIAGVLLALQFKSIKPEMGIAISIAICCIIFGLALYRVDGIFSRLTEFQKYLDESGPYFAVLMKGLGIAYVSGFCSSICKDAGYVAIATQIEIFGKFAIMVIGIPILEAVFETIRFL